MTNSPPIDPPGDDEIPFDSDRCGDSGEREHGRRGHRRRHRRGHRKERVLHTRVSEQLSEDIRRVAEDLRVPVSNLVRNVLEEAFSVVEQVTDDVGELLEDVVEQAERANERMQRFQRRRRAREARHRERAAGREPAAEDVVPLDREGPAAPDSLPDPPARSLAETFPDVLAWQPVVLNAGRRCAFDGRELPPGANAYMGVTGAGGAGPIVSCEAVESQG